MVYWPSITTFTLVKGWNETLTTQFISAVMNVVKINPILSGKVVKTNFPTTIQIIPRNNSTQNSQHDYIHIVDTTTLDDPYPSPKGFENSTLLHYMDTYITPWIELIGSVSDLISTGQSLFGVDLIVLPDGYACYCMKMSHCVGDGVTYYNIMDEINHYMNHGTTANGNSNGRLNHRKSIDWSNPLIASHEIYPEHFSACDVQKSYGFPFFFGLLRNVLSAMPSQKKAYILLNKTKVEEERKILSNRYGIHLSANDIITAALCEANLSTDIFAFTMDKRDRHSKLGGNFHCEIPFDRRFASDPRNFRKVLKDGFYYASDQLPIGPFLLGKVGRISSLATIQKLVSYEGLELLCHSMLSSFVDNVPFDTAFISEMNKESYVILHNFRQIDVEEGGLLKKLLLV